MTWWFTTLLTKIATGGTFVGNPAGVAPRAPWTEATLDAHVVAQSCGAATFAWTVTGATEETPAFIALPSGVALCSVRVEWTLSDANASWSGIGTRPLDVLVAPGAPATLWIEVGGNSPATLAVAVRVQ